MIRHFFDRQELSWTVAEELCLLARRAIATRGRFDLALLDREAARALDGEGSASGIATRDIAGNPLVVETAADPCAFVIFGAGGDLTRRKLVPALYNLAAEGKLPDGVTVVGVSRERASPA